MSIDTILIVLLVIFAAYGFFSGFVQTVGGIVGVVLATLFAGRLYEPIANWILHTVGGNPNLIRDLSFIIAFLIIVRVTGLVFWFLEKILHLLSIIPFLKTINHVAGAVLGFAEGVFVIGAALFILARFPLVTSWQKNLSKSTVAHRLVDSYAVLRPFLPPELRDFDPASYFNPKNLNPEQFLKLIPISPPPT